MPALSVIRTQLSGILRRPGRLLLTGLSVLVAAFVVYSTVLAHQIVTRTTLDTFSDTAEAVSVVVTTEGSDGMAAKQVTGIGRLSGVTQIAGRLTASMSVGDARSGTGLDVLADPGSGAMSRVTLVTGSYPTAKNQIALDRRAATRLGAASGSTLQLRTGDRAKPVKVTVTGVVDGPRDTTEHAWAPDRTVAALAGTSTYSRLDVLAAPGTDLDALQTSVSQLLDSDPNLYPSITTGDVTRKRETTDAARGLDDLFALVAMFVAVAVVAAALVATSTFRIVFTQRLQQLALLRTIGAQRGQLVRALAVEGAVVGLVTGVAGVLLAQAAGFAAPALAAKAGHPLAGADVPVGAAIAVVIGAVLLTTGAVLAPAFAAAGVAPLQALRTASTAGSERGITGPRLAMGVLLILATAALSWYTAGQMSEPQVQTSDILLDLVGIGALAFGTLIVLGPVLIRPVLAVAGWPLRRLGPTGRLALSGIGGTPRRAAAVSVVVALGVAMLAGTVVAIASLRVSTEQSLAASAPADLAMFADNPADFAGVPDAVSADSRFTHVTSFRLTDLDIGDNGLAPSAISLDVTALPALADLKIASGSMTALAPGHAVLSDTLAANLDAATGDVVTLKASKGGTVRVEVVAVLAGRGPLESGAVLTGDDFTKLGGKASGPDGVLADVASGSRDDALAAFRKLGGSSGAEVAVLADLRDQRNGEVDQVLYAALGLLGLTVLIAVVGVATTTSLSVLERTRESGLLRALGLSRSGLRSMIGIEAGLYGVIGAVLGIALGVPFAWLTLSSLKFQLPFTLPVTQLVVIVVVMAAITALAGLVPARRAATVSPIAALATD